MKRGIQGSSANQLEKGFKMALRALTSPAFRALTSPRSTLRQKIYDRNYNNYNKQKKLNGWLVISSQLDSASANQLDFRR